MNSGQPQFHTDILSLSKQMRHSIRKVHVKIWGYSRESVKKPEEQTEETIVTEDMRSVPQEGKSYVYGTLPRD